MARDEARSLICTSLCRIRSLFRKFSTSGVLFVPSFNADVLMLLPKHLILHLTPLRTPTALVLLAVRGQWRRRTDGLVGRSLSVEQKRAMNDRPAVYSALRSFRVHHEAIYCLGCIACQIVPTGVIH